MSTEEIINTVEENNSSTLNVASSKKRQNLLPDRNIEYAEVNEGNSHPGVNSTNKVILICPNHSTNPSDLTGSENASKGEAMTK
eukprot:12524247-Ditylum_brightwellii.AAC.1